MKKIVCLALVFTMVLSLELPIFVGKDINNKNIDRNKTKEVASYPTESYVSTYVSINGGRQQYSFMTHDDIVKLIQINTDLAALIAGIGALCDGITSKLTSVISAEMYFSGRYYEELDKSGGNNGVVFQKDYDAGPGGVFDWAWNTYPYLNY